MQRKDLTSANHIHMGTLETPRMGLFINLLTLLTYLTRAVSACEEDCTDMAGTLCSLTQRCNMAQNSELSNGYPDLPRNFRIDPIRNLDGPPGQNISWSPGNITGYLIGYRMISTPFQSSEQQLCITFSINGTVNDNARFYYDCAHDTSYYHVIMSLPQKDPEKDYIHRIVSAYDKNYDMSNTAKWTPDLIEIYNDSCESLVYIKLKAPSNEYGFSHLRINLTSDELGFTQIRSIYLNSQTAEIMETFSVNYTGEYRITLTLNPNQNNQPDPLCACKLRGSCSSCGQINTSKFVMDSNHTKCRIPVANELYVNSNTQLTLDEATILVAIIICITIIIALALIVVIPILKHRKCKEKSSDSQLATNSSFLQNTVTQRHSLSSNCLSHIPLYEGYTEPSIIYTPPNFETATEASMILQEDDTECLNPRVCNEDSITQYLDGASVQFINSPPLDGKNVPLNYFDHLGTSKEHYRNVSVSKTNISVPCDTLSGASLALHNDNNESELDPTRNKSYFLPYVSMTYDPIDIDIQHREERKIEQANESLSTVNSDLPESHHPNIPTGKDSTYNDERSISI